MWLLIISLELIVSLAEGGIEFSVISHPTWNGNTHMMGQKIYLLEAWDTLV